jgi:hypothetical protein
MSQGAFSVRCFRGETRKPTHRLFRSEAQKFVVAARHLLRYLTRTYKIGGSK